MRSLTPTPPDAITWDGRDPNELAILLGLPRVIARQVVASTMDLAHEQAAAGAPAGTLVLAESQEGGRGRSGRQWVSPPGAGVWMTLVERPNDARALDVLSLRVGLRAARALDRFAGHAVGLKWPNDLYLPDGKVGGILVETRWRDGRPDWVAIGVGVNLEAPPGIARAAGLGRDHDRLEVLAHLVPAVRAAAAARGPLTTGELAEYAERDIAAGRVATLPCAGRVAGIDESGALLIVTAGGVVRCRDGSLLFDGESP